MTIEYRETPEEMILDQLVVYEWYQLSEAARTVLRTALGSAYNACIVHDGEERQVLIRCRRCEREVRR